MKYAALRQLLRESRFEVTEVAAKIEKLVQMFCGPTGKLTPVNSLYGVRTVIVQAEAAIEALEVLERKNEQLRAALLPFARMHRFGTPPLELAMQRGCASDATYIFSEDFARAQHALAEMP